MGFFSNAETSHHWRQNVGEPICAAGEFSVVDTQHQLLKINSCIPDTPNLLPWRPFHLPSLTKFEEDAVNTSDKRPVPSDCVHVHPFIAAQHNHMHGRIKNNQLHHYQIKTYFSEDLRSLARRQNSVSTQSTSRTIGLCCRIMPSGPVVETLRPLSQLTPSVKYQSNELHHYRIATVLRP